MSKSLLDNRDALMRGMALRRAAPIGPTYPFRIGREQGGRDPIEGPAEDLWLVAMKLAQGLLLSEALGP